MKIISRLLLLVSLCGAAPAWADDENALSYLLAMTKAHQTLNYEQLYLLLQGEDVQSLRYRHAFDQGKEYAQLLRLDDGREEIILREDTVSYFGNFSPFSLQARHILDNLPVVLSVDFTQLKSYRFLNAGKGRVADRIARVVRIVPSDDFRYQYRLWIDEENHLLLKSELLDRENNVLETFRVVQNIVDEQFSYIVEPIKTLIIPTLLQHQSPTESVSVPLDWQPAWLPEGFSSLAHQRQHLPDLLMNELVESQLYSDGLFSFTVYLVENKGAVFNEQFWQNGKTSIYSQTVGHKDVVIVGEIPLISARYIIQQIAAQLAKGEK